MSRSKMAELRSEFHRKLCANAICMKTIDKGKHKGEKVVSICDTGSRGSVDISRNMMELIGFPLSEKTIKGQTAGKVFTDLVAEFIEPAFATIHHLRPGNWGVSTSQAKKGIGIYDQYHHLLKLQRVIEEYPEVRAALGGDYLIIPDIVVFHVPVPDEIINQNADVIGADKRIAKQTPFRAENSPENTPILHSSISCKLTIRSDRAQNTRTEALNLVRNRKGATPKIIAVTMEPLPSRIAAIAMGTGDVDCTYHAALPELAEAIETAGLDEQAGFLDDLIKGSRLRDISDLPFDLAI